MAAILLIVAVMTAAVLFYYYGPHSRFRRYGVKYLTPVPLLGDMGRVVFRIQHVLDNLDRIYKAFPTERFVGSCELIRPVVVIRDPDLVKRITIQDFDHFYDHGIAVDQNVDELFGRNLFALKGEHWKYMRSKVSPMFTSSKLKVMLPFMINAGNNVITHIKKSIKKSDKDYVDMDIKDVASRFANDVIASSAYGLHLDSHIPENTEFYEMAKLMSQLKYKQLIKFLGYQVFPSLMKITKATIFSKRASHFFKELFKKTLKARRELTIQHQDLIGMYLQSQQDSLGEGDKLIAAGGVKLNGAEHDNIINKTKSLTETDLLAQIIAFLVAGLDVNASSMAFLTHMLALNPDIQEKLVREIREYDEKNGGQLSYDSILEMPYLEMVVSEMLRIWPASISERECVKDYNLGRPNAKATQDYIIRKGENVRMLLRSIHVDPEYFPDPYKFDPERFSKENRAKLRSGTYNPFGVGPRICIGARFSIIEIKFMIICLLQHMEVLPCERTVTRIQLSTASPMIPLGKGGHWVRLRPRLPTLPSKTSVFST